MIRACSVHQGLGIIPAGQGLYFSCFKTHEQVAKSVRGTIEMTTATRKILPPAWNPLSWTVFAHSHAHSALQFLPRNHPSRPALHEPLQPPVLTVDSTCSGRTRWPLPPEPHHHRDCVCAARPMAMAQAAWHVCMALLRGRRPGACWTTSPEISHARKGWYRTARLVALLV